MSSNDLDNVEHSTPSNNLRTKPTNSTKGQSNKSSRPTTNRLNHTVRFTSTTPRARARRHTRRSSGDYTLPELRLSNRTRIDFLNKLYTKLRLDLTTLQPVVSLVNTLSTRLSSLETTVASVVNVPVVSTSPQQANVSEALTSLNVLLP